VIIKKEHYFRKPNSKRLNAIQIIEIEEVDCRANIFCWVCKYFFLPGCVAYYTPTNTSIVCKDCLIDPKKISAVNEFTCHGLCEVVHMTRKMK
jgi:hypothetical protein